MFPERFDPLEFFEGPTLGGAVVVDLAGRLIRRCMIETRSEVSREFGALHFDERYQFDDGSPEDTMHWAVTRTADGGLDAREPSVVGEMVSQLEGYVWRLAFKRISGPPLTYHASFVQIRQDLVIKRVKLKRFGLTLAELQGFHRRVVG